MASEPRQLRIEFATEESFRSEYASNIANGGIFVATKTAFEVRDPVEVEITLGYCGEKVTFEGEVVHCVPPELAETGATPGVAVQFFQPASEIRDRLEPLAGKIEETNERATNSGRRRAPRATARVAARVKQGQDKTVVGRTRNLSSSGLLMSVEGGPVPVGKVVKLAIAHPTTGEEMELEGRVVRHVEGEGGASIGVQFETPEARQAEVHRFVSDVKASEHSRRLGGISGAISEIGIENLLQMFGTCAQQGTLTVTNGPSEGYIVFEQGLLRASRLGSERGMEALGKMLAWKTGEFEFQARIDDHEFGEPPLPLEGAILEAMRSLDEQAHAAEEEQGDFDELVDDDALADAEAEAVQVSLAEDDGPDDEEMLDIAEDLLSDDLLADEPLVQESLSDVPETFPATAVLVVQSDVAGEARHELGKSEEAVLDLAEVGMNVGKILGVIPEPPEEIHAVIRSLVTRGILSVEE